MPTYSGWSRGVWSGGPWGENYTDVDVVLGGWGYKGWGESPWGQGSDSVVGTGQVGSVTVQTTQNVNVNVTGVSGTGQLGSATVT